MANEDQFTERLNQLFSTHPEMKKTYDLISSLIDSKDFEETEMNIVEYDGITYAIIKEFLVRGDTYCHLVNIDDPLDFMYQKLKNEDGEEHLVELGSERELEIVMAYEQKYIWRDLKRRKEIQKMVDGD